MSVVSVATESATECVSVADIVAATKTMTSTDLFKLLKTFTTEVEKRSKSVKTKTGKREKSDKKEKGPVPNQLKKNHAWVAFTLNHAQENGWESFVIKKKEEEIEMPASVLNESIHIYEDTINEKTPKGRQINRSEAMSLAKVRKDASHVTWKEFEEQFVPDESVIVESSDDTKSTASSKKTTVSVRKTAAEKEAERAEKKAAGEKVKAEKGAERAEKKAAAEKEKAEKAKKKTVEAPNKEEKKAAGGAGAKATESESEAPVAKPIKTATKVLVKSKVEEKIPTVEDDGQAHCVTWKGKTYYMMSTGEAWEQKKDKSMGKWVGMFDAENNTLDTSAEEPVFDEE